MGSQISAQAFSESVFDGACAIAQLGEALDKMTHADRLAAAFTLNRKGQAALFDKASVAIDFDHFVPTDRNPRCEVIHHGRNTLPVLPKHRRFQKRFCRPEGKDACLFGYNEAPSRWFLGPGYFVAHDTADNERWRPLGDIVVDYFMVPDAPVVEGWPAVKPNSQGLQMFVYKGTRDFMRKVSEHVSIGAAYKGEKALGHYFVLVRED